jgi:nucleotide-binding universal stress UspA family protein
MPSLSVRTADTPAPSTNGPGGAAAWQQAVSLGAMLRSRPIVVAVSGEPDGAGPVRAAAALERQYHCRVAAVRVLDVSDTPLLAPLPSARTFGAEPTGDAPYAEDARACRRRVSAWLGQSSTWPIRITPGATAYEISRYAERERAALIVMGLRQHGSSDCGLRDEATLTVARLAGCAVLAVTPRLVGFPRRVIAGIDFGPASIPVARAALDLLRSPTSADPAHLRLVHVDRGPAEATPADTVDTADTAGEALVRHLGTAAAFEQLVGELAAPPGVHVECVTLRGDTAAELLACANQSRAELIVLGRSRLEPTKRGVLGGVTTEVIRDGRCSVLAVTTP